MAKRKPDMSTMPVPERLALAQRILGHEFSDQQLLQRALTHPSAVEDRDPSSYYERLEFLGDSIVGFLISEELYRRFPHMPEGGMTRIKVSIVAGSVLANVSSDLGLSEALILGDSEIGTGRRGLNSALENVFEALVAALYLDAGIDAAREWVRTTLGPLISEEVASFPENPKSALQELVQSRGESPRYRIDRQEGPPHARVFAASVEVDGRVIGSGTGNTKKEAEAAAAAAALDALAD